jgi:hypothetical protein
VGLNPEVAVFLRIIQKEFPAVRLEVGYEILVIILKVSKASERALKLERLENPLHIRVVTEILFVDMLQIHALKGIIHPSFP